MVLWCGVGAGGLVSMWCWCGGYVLAVWFPALLVRWCCGVGVGGLVLVVVAWVSAVLVVQLAKWMSRAHCLAMSRAQ